MDVNPKICFVLSHLPQGGAERQTINLIRQLIQSGYNITLLLYASTEIFYREIFDEKIRIIIHESPRTNWVFRNILNGLYLRKTLRQNDFDILHTLLFHNGFWVRLLAPSKYTGRIVYSIRNDLKDASGFFLWTEKIFIRRSFVTANSHKVMTQFANYVSKRHKDRISTIYNGFDVTRFLVHTKPSVSGYIIIGTVGRQNKQKNQLQILEAINLVSRHYPIRFYLIGDVNQDQADANRHFVESHGMREIVTILDAQSHIEQYYREFNIFILSSVYESCPNALFEAMLARCLCIVSNGANTDSFIRDGINGSVYNGTTAHLTEKLISAVELVLSNRHQTMIENAQRYAMENFSVDSMADSYVKIYEMIMSDRRKN